MGDLVEMEKNSVRVQVAGQEFCLAGAEDSAYIQSVANYTDEKILEIQKANPNLSTSACVLLASLNLADELFKLRQQYSELDHRIAELRTIAVPAAPVKPTRGRPAKTPAKHPFDEVNV